MVATDGLGSGSNPSAFMASGIPFETRNEDEDPSQRRLQIQRDRMVHAPSQHELSKSCNTIVSKLGDVLGKDLSVIGVPAKRKPNAILCGLFRPMRLMLHHDHGQIRREWLTNVSGTFVGFMMLRSNSLFIVWSNSVCVFSRLSTPISHSNQSNGAAEAISKW